MLVQTSGPVVSSQLQETQQGGKCNEDMGPILSKQKHFRQETIKKKKKKTSEKKKHSAGLKTEYARTQVTSINVGSKCGSGG